MYPTLPLVPEAMAIDNGEVSFPPTTLIHSCLLTKDQSIIHSKTIANKLIEYVIGRNPHDSQELNNDLNSLLRKFAQKNGPEKSKLDNVFLVYYDMLYMYIIHIYHHNISS